MSDNNFQGYIKIRQLSNQRMYTLRASLNSTKIKSVIKSVLGVPVPKIRTCSVYGRISLAWMAHDELLIMVNEPQSQVYNDLQKNLVNHHALLSDVSDARVAFELSGPAVCEVLAKLTPMDTHSTKFQVGSFRRTRIAQVAGAVYRRDEQAIVLICFRSVEQYISSLLHAAAQQGSQVF
jgi:sarcosine oxidase subunit gamma